MHLVHIQTIYVGILGNTFQEKLSYSPQNTMCIIKLVSSVFVMTDKTA
jgi:hypothetical protein